MDTGVRGCLRGGRLTLSLSGFTIFRRYGLMRCILKELDVLFVIFFFDKVSFLPVPRLIPLSFLLVLPDGVLLTRFFAGFLSENPSPKCRPRFVAKLGSFPSDLYLFGVRCIIIIIQESLMSVAVVCDPTYNFKKYFCACVRI